MLSFCNWMGPWISTPNKQDGYMGDNSLESKYYRILTGHNLDVKELDRCAERAFNLHRAYTARQMQTTDMAVLWFVIPCEWLGWKKLRAMLMKLIMPLVALGIILSTLHQSSLGGLYVMVPSKMHPLWYSSWLPVYFFVSSLYAGLSMVIFEGTLAHAGMHKYMDENHAKSFDGVSLSLARGASLVMMGYFVIKIGGLTLDNGWKYVFSGYGLLWLLEMALVIVPAFMFAVGVRERRYGMIRLAAGLSVFGVMLNRMDVSLVAYNYNLPTHLKYFPSLGEITLSLFMDCHTRMKVEKPRANDCQSCHIKRDPAEAPVW